MFITATAASLRAKGQKSIYDNVHLNGYIALLEQKIELAIKEGEFFTILPWQNLNSFERLEIEKSLISYGYSIKRNDKAGNNCLHVRW